MSLPILVGVLIGCTESGTLEHCVKLNLPGESGHPRYFEILLDMSRKGQEDSLLEFVQIWAECERKLEAAGISIAVKP